MRQPEIKETCKIVYGSWEDCFKRYKKIVALQKKRHQEIVTLQLDIQDNPHYQHNCRGFTQKHRSTNVLVWRYGYATS